MRIRSQTVVFFNTSTGFHLLIDSTDPVWSAWPVNLSPQPWEGQELAVEVALPEQLGVATHVGEVRLVPLSMTTGERLAAPPPLVVTVTYQITP